MIFPDRYVDSREPDEIKVPMQQMGWKCKALSAGDFLFAVAGGGICIIERKAVYQYLTDMQTGQLTNQCRKLKEESDFPILLLEGRWTQNEEGNLLGENITWEQAWNYAQTIQDSFSIRIQLSTSVQHSIKRVNQLLVYYSKDVHSNSERTPSGDLRLSALSLVHGIGQAKGKAILNMFGGKLVNVAVAEPDKLEMVPGIGPKQAKRVWEFFNT